MVNGWSQNKNISPSDIYRKTLNESDVDQNEKLTTILANSQSYKNVAKSFKYRRNFRMFEIASIQHFKNFTIFEHLKCSIFSKYEDI